MGGISPMNLVIIAVIVVLLFGTKKLRTLGSDLGASIKGFKKAMGDENSTSSAQTDKTLAEDADFAEKSITEQSPQPRSEEAKSQNKEQV